MIFVRIKMREKLLQSKSKNPRKWYNFSDKLIIIQPIEVHINGAEFMKILVK